MSAALDCVSQKFLSLEHLLLLLQLVAVKHLHLLLVLRVLVRINIGLDILLLLVNLQNFVSTNLADNSWC